MEAIQHVYKQNTVQHGHLSVPKNTNNQHTSNIKAEQSVDYGIVEDIADLEFADDFHFNTDHVDLNWLSHYLSFLLAAFHSQEEAQVAHFAINFQEVKQAPIYILNQDFRI